MHNFQQSNQPHVKLGQTWKCPISGARYLVSEQEIENVFTLMKLDETRKRVPNCTAMQIRSYFEISEG